MASTTEGNRLHDILKHEEDNMHSRETVTVLSGQDLAVGAVIGKITKSIGTATADAGNTGDGTVSGEVMGASTQIGTYTLTCTAAATDAGTFAVVAPDGTALPDLTVGVAYSNPHIGMTIADGATDFVVGDIFTVVVSAGSGKVTAMSLTAVDGSQDAYGVLAAAVDASAADTTGPAIVRDAQIVAANLVWASGASTAQKNAGLALLAAKGIIERVDA